MTIALKKMNKEEEPIFQCMRRLGTKDKDVAKAVGFSLATLSNVRLQKRLLSRKKWIIVISTILPELIKNEGYDEKSMRSTKVLLTKQRRLNRGYDSKSKADAAAYLKNNLKMENREELLCKQ